MCSYTATTVSVSRRPTQLCSWGVTGSLSLNFQRLHLGVEAVRRNFVVQVNFLGLPSAVTPCPSSIAVTLPSLLNGDNSEATMVVARAGFAFGGVCTEVGHGGTPKLLHSDNSAEISAPIKPYFVFIYFAVYISLLTQS
ncbi:hypothetical protein Acr_00g0044210 [Actinidia rufa]|uniref:Uncharacterized protein n=1 Tax=Actinidia rufa TaxID=165716 RepID=A0A7J0DIV0_9ERIC|nr:hypothetical protein Acr_00g0044210 [Actinidia rufa]